MILAPSGDVTDLPNALEGFSPADGAIVQRQTQVEVDLRAGYDLQLVIDGITIPLEDMDFTPATGKYAFRPGPDKVITEWLPGFHIVEIEFDRAVGLPDPGAIRWSFRIQ